eukprot:5350255-Pyramimonas_sp.AAC.2
MAEGTSGRYTHSMWSRERVRVPRPDSLPFVGAEGTSGCYTHSARSREHVPVPRPDALSTGEQRAHLVATLTP